MPYHPCKCGHGKSFHSEHRGVQRCFSSCGCKEFQDATPEERKQFKQAAKSRNKTERPNYMRDAKRRSRLKERGDELGALAVGLPKIDFAVAERLMEEDISHVPDGWPENWQWIVFLHKIMEDITETQEIVMTKEMRLENLQSLAEGVVRWFNSGDAYFGVNQARQEKLGRVEKSDGMTATVRPVEANKLVAPVAP